MDVHETYSEIINWQAWPNKTAGSAGEFLKYQDTAWLGNLKF
jgi:hypothetical protein